MATSSILPSVHAAVATNGLRDIKPPVEIPSGWVWIWWGIAAVAVVLIACVAWRFWRKKRSAAPPAIFVPPHERARQRLQEALSLLSQPEPFCVAVSSAVRDYLEERFDFHAPERTTEEFLHELQGTRLLIASQKASLGEFLTSCDLVKFARYQPGEPELRALHEAAMRLVDETLSMALPLPPTPSGPPRLPRPQSTVA